MICDRGGVPPSFEGISGAVHDRVRQEMKQVLSEAEPISFLEDKAAKFSRKRASRSRLPTWKRSTGRVDGDSILLFGWQGDATHDALALLLTAREIQTSNEGVAIRISSTDQQRLLKSLQEIGSGPVPSVADLKIKPQDAIREKWDWALPEDLDDVVTSAQLDLLGGQRWALGLFQASGA